MADSDRNRPQTVDNGTGMTRVLYIISTAENPITVDEIADHSGEKSETIRSTLTRLHDRGFVARRVRQLDRVGFHPYEYALMPPEEVPGGEDG